MAPPAGPPCPEPPPPPPPSPPSLPSPREPISRVIGDFIAGGDAPRVRLMDLAELLAERAFGMLLILFALPNFIPIPGLSLVCGLPIAWLGVQMAAGRRKPWLPQRFASVTIDRVLFRQLIVRVEPWMVRVERRLRPRLFFFTSRLVERFLGGFLFALGITLALPIPLGNVPPGIAVIILALGLMERDGAVVLFGLLVGVVAMAFALSMAAGVAGGIFLAWRYLLPSL